MTQTSDPFFFFKPWNRNVFLKHLWFLLDLCKFCTSPFLLALFFIPVSLSIFKKRNFSPFLMFTWLNVEIQGLPITWLHSFTSVLASTRLPCGWNLHLSDPSFVSWGGQKEKGSVFSNFNSELLLLLRGSQITGLS